MQRCDFHIIMEIAIQCGNEGWRMNTFLRACLTLCAAAVLFSGCGAQEESGQASEAEPEEILYPVRIEENEICVGETTVQTLLDDGLVVTVSEMTDQNELVQYEVDPEMELEANSYYAGGSVWITDHVSASISFVTKEESVRMGEAVIACLEFDMAGAEDAELAKIAFNGVPVNEMSREKAGEMFPAFEGDDNVLFFYGSDYEYYMSFDAQEKRLVSFSAARKYDVDWSSEE